MTQLTVASPALPCLIHIRNGFPVALDAIGLNDLFTMGRQRDGLRYISGMENNHILHPVDGFPQVVLRRVSVGQMAVHAADATMGAGVPPRCVLIFHHMAARAEIRGFGFCQEFGRPQKNEQHDGRATQERQNKSCK